MKDNSSIDPQYFEALRKKLICGEITAVTFDTQIFDRNGKTFRGGLMEQLGQLKHSPIQLVVTELVRDEAEKHMLAMHQAKALRAEEALTNLSKYLSEDLLVELEGELRSHISPEGIVFREINDFFIATNAELLFYEEVSTRKLFSRYFKSEPPFHKQNHKKNEFPDAIALLCLEEYSELHGVLVVSDDKDWITFCCESESQKLHCVPDLNVALTLINSVESNIKDITAGRILKFDRFNESGALLMSIKQNIVNDLPESLVFTGRTNFLFAATCTAVEIISVNHEEGKSFGKIRDDLSLTAWVLELDVECCLDISVTFSSEDAGVVGSSRYEKQLTIPCMSIIKISEDTIKVETMMNKQISLDLGVISPHEGYIQN
ncbi:PIN domain-containing protein [Pseudomonas brassicacearum]|uniref:PIN domain-containing protein n=1 Tax=Pseudomonas brassicacearum TaxID=930166 RepID=UPI003ECF76B4